MAVRWLSHLHHRAPRSSSPTSMRRGRNRRLRNRDARWDRHRSCRRRRQGRVCRGSRRPLLLHVRQRGRVVQQRRCRYAPVQGSLGSVCRRLQVDDGRQLFRRRPRHPGIRSSDETADRSHVVNTSSFAALDFAASNGAYGASKAAVSSLSDALREEFREHGDDFGVTVVYPGAVRTRIATSERLRPENQRSSSRGVEPYGPTHDSINLAYSEVLDPEQIGHLVVDAVRSNAPTSLTHPAPADFLQARLASIESSGRRPHGHRQRDRRNRSNYGHEIYATRISGFDD